MSVQGQIVISLIAALLLFHVVSMTVRGRLSEVWCLLWAVVLIASVVLVNIPALLNRATALVGAIYPASALTMVALFFLLVLAIHASGEATIHSRQIVALGRELALLRRTLEQHLESCPGLPTSGDPRSAKSDGKG